MSETGPRGVAKVEGRHWVSPFNFMPEVTNYYEIPQPLGLIDSTIRKVIYTLGIRPTARDLLEIAEILDDLGIGEESLNTWYRGGTEPTAYEFFAIETLAKAGFSFKINVFTDSLLGDGTTEMPLMRQHVDMFDAMGIKLLNPGLLQPPNESARQRQTEQMAEMADYIRAAGLEWNATIANCGRRDFDGFVDLTNRAIEAGVRRLDLMDSTSTLSPQAMTHFIRTYRSRMVRPTPLTMHTHNEFGMATAGTIAAVIAGASPDVALNGVSYRSGFAALEEVVLALDVLYGADTGIRLDRLQPSAERLARIMGLPIPPLKAVTGSHQYKRESPADIGRIVGGNADAEFSMAGSSVAPSLTGAEFSWVWAVQANEQVIEIVADKLGLTLAPAAVAAARTRLDSIAAARPAYPRWATPEEVEAVVRDMATSAEARRQA